MKCHICGYELGADAKFCSVCGASVANQQPQPTVVQQTSLSQEPPKKEKKKKNVAIKVIAVVLALLILAGGGLFLADSIMFKKEVEAQEIITDFPVLKQKTDFLVYDEEIFPSTHYRITVERISGGGVLKSEAFRQTKVIIEDESTEPVYNIDFEEDGEYLITLEDISEENTTKAELTTAYVEPETEPETEAEKESDEEPLIVIIKVKVDDASEEAIDKVSIDSQKGDDPVEIPTTEREGISGEKEETDSPETTRPYDEDETIADFGEPIQEEWTTYVLDDTNESAPEFSIGDVVGSKYTNSYIGLSCDVPSSLTVYNKEQMLKLNSIASAYIDDSVLEQLEKADIVYCLCAVNELTGDSINVNFEKMSSVILAKYSVKEILESQVSIVKSSFSKMGYTDININYQKVTVKGRSFDALKMTAKINGIDFYSTMLSYMDGNNMVLINVASTQEDKSDTFLNCFTFS